MQVDCNNYKWETYNWEYKFVVTVYSVIVTITDKKSISQIQIWHNCLQVDCSNYKWETCNWDYKFVVTVCDYK